MTADAIVSALLTVIMTAAVFGGLVLCLGYSVWHILTGNGLRPLPRWLRRRLWLILAMAIYQ
jgi:hypothetical protein